MTIAMLMKLTGLSRNTIKARPGVQVRLDEIEAAHASAAAQLSASQAGEDAPSEVELLLADKDALIKQNVSFFEEILSLRAIIKRKDAELKKLRNRA